MHSWLWFVTVVPSHSGQSRTYEKGNNRRLLPRSGKDMRGCGSYMEPLVRLSLVLLHVTWSFNSSALDGYQILLDVRGFTKVVYGSMAVDYLQR